MSRPPKAKTAAKESTGSFAWGQHFIHCIRHSLGEGGHLVPQIALRDIAFLQREATPQVVSAAKDNMVGVDCVSLRFAPAVLAKGRMPSSQSGDCPARSASSSPKAKPQSLPRQRDTRRALIETDLVDTARCDSSFPQSEATPQVLSGAKNNMVALPGKLFYSTQIPVCLLFSGKNNTLDSANNARLFDGETELSLVA